MFSYHDLFFKGYAYIILESEKAVKALLTVCTSDYTNSGNYYFKIGSKRMKSKDVSENIY